MDSFEITNLSSIVEEVDNVRHLQITIPWMALIFFAAVCILDIDWRTLSLALETSMSDITLRVLFKRTKHHLPRRPTKIKQCISTKSEIIIAEGRTGYSWEILKILWAWLSPSRGTNWKTTHISRHIFFFFGSLP